jgi:hypothetical protein
MKKYLLGVIAILIGVGLSAFTNQTKHTKSSKSFDSFYWYFVDDVSTDSKASSPAFGGALTTQSDAETHTPCDVGSNRDCIRGYTSQLTVDDPGPGQAVPIQKP